MRVAMPSIRASGPVVSTIRPVDSPNIHANSDMLASGCTVSSRRDAITMCASATANPPRLHT
jgi:hypothetical protein